MAQPVEGTLRERQRATANDFQQTDRSEKEGHENSLRPRPRDNRNVASLRAATMIAGHRGYRARKIFTDMLNRLVICGCSGIPFNLPTSGERRERCSSRGGAGVYRLGVGGRSLLPPSANGDGRVGDMETGGAVSFLVGGARRRAQCCDLTGLVSEGIQFQLPSRRLPVAANAAAAITSSSYS